MKKIVEVLVCSIIALALASTASAETFSPRNCIRVDADRSGLVTITGDQADVALFSNLVQFCPDQFKSGCGYNWVVSPVGSGSFRLDMRVVDLNQRAFNGKSAALWLAVPNPLVVVGNNLLLEMSQSSLDSEDGKGGAHFTFVGDLEGETYKVLYPVSQGGEACRETKVEVVALPEAKVEVKVDPPAPKVAPPAKQDSSVKVTGDKNLTAKKGAAAVKGKVNTTGVGVNVKGDHNKITVTIINGKPEVHYDKSCTACHASSPYNKK